MSEGAPQLDHLLVDWRYSPGQILVRQVQGADGRDVIQMRVDLGVLQLECTGRPDGVKPEGFETYYDYLVSLSINEGRSYQLDEENCHEVDREFYQFYHRRICWLQLKRYPEVVKDAQHSLELMDFSSAHSPDPEWSLLHEQYRPFVMFHMIQAKALIALADNNPELALKDIDSGLQDLAKVFEKHEASEYFEEDAFVKKLGEMRASITDHHELGPTLSEQLVEAIAAEQYELAAELRDRLDLRGGEK